MWSLCRGVQEMTERGQLAGCEVTYLGQWKRKGGLLGIYFGSLAHRGRKLTFCGTLTDMREVGRACGPRRTQSFGTMKLGLSVGRWRGPAVAT